ncbi:putative pentatricopeptide repeat-containing protein At1g12700, mitochondrial [Trifolium pratense]|uniref:putative pentatricopeptide repeat-containing protein At1g12700, mitochondrial n=1 Tax=Trifolium pratense TaxID=57577 RepID=UPI001E6928D0|nr:putative pentatricopeptide repeat-containing protein At1g12700, mitochondrial [Trifolium pratense]
MLSISRLRYAFLSVSSSIPNRQSRQPLPSFIDNLDDAVSSFNRILYTNSTKSIIEFNKILSSLVKINHYPTASSFSQQMEPTGIQPCIVTLSILMNCFCHIGKLNFAFSILAKFLKLGYKPDIVILTTLLKGLCLNGKVNLCFHDDVIVKGFRFDHVSYATLINGLCKIGRTRASVLVLRKIELMVRVKPDVVMYNTIIDSLCQEFLSSYVSMSCRGDD